MRKSKAILSMLTCLALLNSACVSNNVVKRVSVTENGNNRAKEMKGVFYALPLTVVTASVTVARIQEKPGKFQQFASLYFPHQTGVIEKEKVSFELDPDKVRLGVSSEPDPTQVYLAEIQGGWFGGFFEDKSLALDMTDGGVLKSGAAETTNQTLPIVLETVGAIASVIKTSVLGAASVEGQAMMVANARNKMNDTMGAKPNCKPPTAGEEKAFYGLLKNDAETNFYRNTLEDDDERCFYRSLKKRDRAVFYSLGNDDRARATYRKLNEEDRDFARRLFAQRSNNCEIEFYLNLGESERGYYQVMTQSDRDIYRGLTTEERSYFVGLDQEERKVYGKTTKRDEFKQAKELAEEIEKLNSRRLGVISSTELITPADAIKVQLAELDAKIEALTKHFFGAKKSVEWTGRFEFVPDKDRVMSRGMQSPTREGDLLNFSKEYGVCILNQDVNQPPPNFINPNCSQHMCEKDYTLRLEVPRGRQGRAGEQISDVIEVAELKNNSKRGFYYRVPADALAKVMRVVQGKTPVEISRQPISMAQYGKTFSLPSSSGGRNTKYALTLSEHTGALKNFTLGSSALLDTGMISGLGETATSLIEAKKKKDAEDEARQTPPDELKQLERRRQILEEMIKIKKAEAELKNQ